MSLCTAVHTVQKQISFDVEQVNENLLLKFKLYIFVAAFMFIL